MAISDTPPIEMMSEVDAQRLQETIEDVPTASDVAGSADDLCTDDSYRYRTDRIVGLSKKVRFRSLSTKDFRHVQNEDGTNDLDELVRLAIVDANGHQYLTASDIAEFRNSDRYDVRTWQHLLQIAITHCLGGSLEDLTELAAKN